MLKHCLIYIVLLYQKTLSRMLPPTCRFSPTCSAYMIDALTAYPVPKALFLGVSRILKCHPFHPGGFDPVRSPK